MDALLCLIPEVSVQRKYAYFAIGLVGSIGRHEPKGQSRQRQAAKRSARLHLGSVPNQISCPFWDCTTHNPALPDAVVRSRLALPSTYAR